MKFGINHKAIIVSTIAYFIAAVPVALIGSLFLGGVFARIVEILFGASDARDKSAIAAASTLLMLGALVVSGLISGRISGKAQFVNGALVGFVVLCIYAFLYPLSSDRGGDQPLWTYIAFFGLHVPATLFGGFLSIRYPGQKTPTKQQV